MWVPSHNVYLRVVLAVSCSCVCFCELVRVIVLTWASSSSSSFSFADPLTGTSIIVFAHVYVRTCERVETCICVLTSSHRGHSSHDSGLLVMDMEAIAAAVSVESIASDSDSQPPVCAARKDTDTPTVTATTTTSTSPLASSLRLDAHAPPKRGSPVRTGGLHSKTVSFADDPSKAVPVTTGHDPVSPLENRPTSFWMFTIFFFVSGGAVCGRVTGVYGAAVACVVFFFCWH